MVSLTVSQMYGHPGCLDLWHATRAGRMEEAWALQKTGIEMTKLFTSDGRTLYASTKAVMNHLAIPGGGSLRLPLRPLSGEALTVLMADMDRLLVAGTT